MTIKRNQIGARMSQAVIHGGTVYLAGQTAQDAPGASVADQTKNILDRIDALLAEAGSDRNHMLSATIWLNSMDDFAEMNAVWDAWVPEGHTPARACVESPRLARPTFTVEIGIIAAVK
jgi:enamine deaminase RidA (YjgF/YER057c/UK114 family)